MWTVFSDKTKDIVAIIIGIFSKSDFIIVYFNYKIIGLNPGLAIRVVSLY